jgi:hypothetical protein
MDAGEPTRKGLLSSGIVEVASPVSWRLLMRDRMRECAWSSFGSR